VVEAAKQRGILISATGPQALRLVTHLDVSGDGFQRCIDALIDAVTAS
jgi:hypothetical protein